MFIKIACQLQRAEFTLVPYFFAQKISILLLPFPKNYGYIFGFEKLSSRS